MFNQQILNASSYYDSLPPHLRSIPRKLIGFSAGAQWMKAVMEQVRSTEIPKNSVNFEKLGIIKYALALSIALIGFTFLQGFFGLLLAAIISVLLFYVVEVQFLFLFPVAIDDETTPIQESIRLRRQTFSTFQAISIVLPIACFMLIGGFLRQGFYRSWCIGCVAIILLYEKIRHPSLIAKTKPLNRLEIGLYQPLLIREEGLEVKDAVRILFISDLHLNRFNFNFINKQIFAACEFTHPDILVLGGDLIDDSVLLSQLELLLSSLSRIYPTVAVLGNHDNYLGREKLITIFQETGVVFLESENLVLDIRDRKLSFCGNLANSNDLLGVRIFCTHQPKTFLQLAPQQFDYCFAGHYHGSQFHAFHKNELSYPGAWFFPYHGIKFQIDQMSLLISRGVCDTLPFRWRCPREVILCRL